MKTLFSLTLLMMLVLTTQAQTKKPKTVAPASPSGGKPNTTVKSSNGAYIVGTWNQVQMPTGDGMSQDQSWTFTKNSFVAESSPELKQKGMYKIMKEKGDTLFLKLYKQEGKWGTADKEQKIVIDKENARIRIGWKEFRKKE